MENARKHAAVLVEWLDEPLGRKSLTRARAAFDGLAEALTFEPALRDELAPVLVNVFLRTGYLKDYKSLEKFARRVRRPDLLEEVAPVVRGELPDIWILNALAARRIDDALDAWFEAEDHERIRLCAKQIIAATPGRIDVLISARLSEVAYQIGRSTRSRYRRAGRVLATLRGELQRAQEPGMWTLVQEDLLAQFGHRPALVDELEKAGII